MRASFLHLSLLALCTARPQAHPRSTGNKYPFTNIIAFGDNLSDNGNGSYAHLVSGDPGVSNSIYGYGTWTDHQVAVSYLSTSLSLPLSQNYAFGHAWGGSSGGATVDDTDWNPDGISSPLWHSNFSSSLSAGPFFPSEFSSPCWGAPSSKVQIQDYINARKVDPSALHFLWIGNNDLNMYTFYKGDTFIKAFTSAIVEQVTNLLSNGAQYIFVVNVYPKHLAPVVPNYYPGWTTQDSWNAFGDFISKTNTALQSALSGQFDEEKVLYYDAFSFMRDLWEDGDANGFTNKLDSPSDWPSFCDGDKKMPTAVQQLKDSGAIEDPKNQNNWGVCVEMQQWSKWFWMQFLDPTSAVHEKVAADMSVQIEGHWG